MLCDLPGFHDTRGLGYDLSAALSVTRAIKHARSVKGVVLVIPFGSIFLERGNAFIDAFNNLQEMFVNGFRGLSAGERQAIHLVISQSKDADTDKVTFTGMIESFCAETRTLMLAAGGRDDNLQIRMDIWLLVQSMLAAKKVLFVNVCNSFQKTQFLAACAAGVGVAPIAKCQFTEVFERGSYQKAFSDTLQRSLSIWHKLLLQRYLDDIPTSQQQDRDFIAKKREEIFSMEASNVECVLSVETRNASIANYRKRLEQLRAMTSESDLQSIADSDIMAEFAAEGCNAVNAKCLELVDLADKTVACEAQMELKRAAVRDKKRAIRVLQLEVKNAEEKIASLSRGNVVISLAERNFDAAGDLHLSAWKEGALEAVHAEVREVRDDDFIAGWQQTFCCGMYTGVVNCTRYIAKEFRLVPHVGGDQLDAFYSGRRVSSDRGGGLYWVATLRGHNARLADGPYKPKAAPGGKAMVYSIELTFEGPGRPLPWYR